MRDRVRSVCHPGHSQDAASQPPAAVPNSSHIKQTSVFLLGGIRKFPRRRRVINVRRQLPATPRLQYDTTRFFACLIACSAANQPLAALAVNFVASPRSALLLCIKAHAARGIAYAQGPALHIVHTTTAAQPTGSPAGSSSNMSRHHSRLQQQAAARCSSGGSRSALMGCSKGSAVAAAAPSLLLMALLVAAGSTAVAAQQQPLTQGPVLLNELLTSPAGKLPVGSAAPSWEAITNSTEWFELRNSGNSPADISGWTVQEGSSSDGQQQQQQNGQIKGSWSFPGGTVLPASGFFLVLCPRNTGNLPTAPNGSNVLVTDQLKVKQSGLELRDSSGKLQAATGRLPEDQPGVSVGLPQPPPSAAAASPYTYLAKQTPWLANSGPSTAFGPYIESVERLPEGVVSAGQSITVTALLLPNQAAITGATLSYRVNFGPEQAGAMAASGTASSSNGTAGGVQFSGTIPASQFKAGDMVRWSVKATDAGGGVTIDPAPGPEQERYHGVVIPLAGNNSLPILYWFTEDAVAAQSQAGGISSISWAGDFYDGVESRRRGVTTLTWAKPKMTFEGAPDGFIIRPGIPRVDELKLNSLFAELGELSFMKEVVAYQVMADEGVIAPISQHIQVYLNGRFAGLYELIEDVESGLLERFGLPTDGPMFKSESGEFSNLRWDVGEKELKSYYAKSNRKSNTGDWQLLIDFTKGLAGGGPVNRTSFLYDSTNLPAVINEAAVQTLLGNMDRCTKNFYVYQNPETSEWYRIAWDVEASMGQDNGLGGAPGELYCILACEQWNSPLYCDSEHPQDIGNIQTAWGEVTAVGLNPYTGPARGASGRRRRLMQLQQQQQQQQQETSDNAADPPAAASPAPAESSASPIPTPAPAAGATPAAGAPAPALTAAPATHALPASALRAAGKQQLTFPQPQGWDDPNRNTVGTRSVSGAAGTYNHLTDALLDVTSTRAMYMRRLRILADKYYGQGRLRQIIDDTWQKIKGVAAQDNTVWQRGDGSRGYQQLTTEFLPIRTWQLLQVYAPGGQRPLLPGPQDNSQVVLAFGGLQLSGPRQEAYISLVLQSPAAQAIDVSGWKITSSAGNSFVFPSGTVFPPGGVLYLSPDVKAFRARAASPKAGEAAFVLTVPDQLLPSSGSTGSYTVVDDRGQIIRLV